MSRCSLRSLGAAAAVVLTAAVSLAACGKQDQREPLLPSETFTWVAQPVAFSPPPEQWERQGDGGAGTVGVRFILRGGGGQCISVAAYRSLAERDRRKDLQQLISERASLSQREFLHDLSLARPRTDDPVSEREAAVARAINEALDRAGEDYLEGDETAAEYNLEAALQAASNYQPTLEELVPRLRMLPHRMQEPERWRLGAERDTVLAGLPAFATDDTLFASEQWLLYHEVFWVVNGCAFKATYQGRPENLKTFQRVVDSFQFPEAADASGL